MGDINKSEGESDTNSPEPEEAIDVDVRKEMLRDFVINKYTPAQLSEKYGFSLETILNVLKDATTEEPQLAERPSGDLVDPDAITPQDVLRRLAELQSEQEDEELEVATMREKASAAAISEISKTTSKETRDRIKEELLLARSLEKRYGALAAQYGMELEDFINHAVEFYIEHGSDFTTMSNELTALKIQRDKLAEMLVTKNYKAEIIEKTVAMSLLAGQKLPEDTFNSLIKIFDREGL